MAEKTSADGMEDAGGGQSAKPSVLHQYFNIQDVDCLQIGPRNEMVFHEGTERLRKGRQDDGLGKNEVLVAMINSILNPDCVANPVPKSLQEVNATFKKHYSAATGSSEKSSFKEVYGLPLQTFFDGYSNLYDVFTEKGVSKVKLKKPKKKKKKKKKGKDDTSETAEKETTEAQAVPVHPEESVPGFSALDFASREEWTVVRTKETKTRKKKKSKQEEEKVEEPVVLVRSISEEKAEALVRHLLNKPEGDDLLLYPDDSIYKENRGKLMQDIMSLWNSPFLAGRHILLGVSPNTQPPHTLVGLSSGICDDFYQCHFVRNYFAIAPQFEYYECAMEGRIIGVIEVGNSLGKGVPAIPCRDDEDGNFKVDELWVRSGKENIVCRHSNPKTTQIHQWFGGSKFAASREDAPLPPSEEDTCVKQGAEKAKDSLKRSVVEEQFLSAARNFRKGHYSLVIGETGLSPRQLGAIPLVPWISVFDFDPFSRDSGVLCNVENEISKRRNPHILTWRNPIGSPTDSGIQWIFLLGMRELPESRTSHELAKWQRATESAVLTVCRQHAIFVEDYTVLTLVVLWPEDPTTARCIAKFLIKLFEVMKNPSPRVILCCAEEPKDEKARRALLSLQDDFEKDLSWIKISPSEVCTAIKNSISEDESGSKMTFVLPAANGESCKISEKDVAWLKEDLEVLYEENPYNKAVTDVEALQKEQDNFFRGGTLHWFAWYGLGSGHLDVERDIMKNILRFLQEEHLSRNRSGTVKLYHAPGSGGSTLAQRILWELRQTSPCAQVKQRSGASVENLVERIVFLHNETHLPVILLLDGVDESRLTQLSTFFLRHPVVFLKVRRYAYRIEKPYCREKDSAFFLTGTVSPGEATRLAIKFSDRCKEDDDKREKLKTLSEDVASGTSQHYMYEFGMTVYLQEFRGVEAHVQGYLQLHKNPGRELLSWQRGLGYLALVHYYSQSSIPMQFFAPLLNKPPNFAMDVEDFPHPMHEFIVPDRIESREKCVRICHYIVSKEILEQLLNRSQKRTEDKERLSREARHNLKSFCLSFIDQTTSKKVKSLVKSYAVQLILTKTFIFRDNRDVGEDDMHPRKRPPFSQIMFDLDEKTPYSNREAVLKKLTETFSEEPNFLAHLGRFYAICRPELEKEAEDCLNRAFEICRRKEELQGKDDNLMQTLMHIHHMYGIILQRRFVKYTGRTHEETAFAGRFAVNPDSFAAVAEEVLFNAKRACQNFQKCRENTRQGEEKSYGFRSEIEVRLQVCDFLARHVDGGIGALMFKPTAPTAQFSRFVRESFNAIDDLILECWTLVDVENIDDDFQKFVIWYSQLFKGEVVIADRNAMGDDISSLRMAIASVKLKYDNCYKNGGSVMYNVTSKEDLNFLVSKYEGIFSRSQRSGDYSKRCLEIDYKEWLDLIRNPRLEKTYDLEEVLDHVKQWHDMVRSPASKFYVFVLTSLLGFGTSGRRGNSESLVEAVQYQDTMEKMSRAVLNPRRAREWLGCVESRGIRILVPGSKIGHIGHCRDQSGEDTPLLAICKGSILHPNTNKLAGYINLDLGDNTIPLHVFFIPLKANLDGPRHVHRRVEFWLAFTMEHGYEAFGVCELRKYTCTKCLSRMEITSEEEFVYCNCGAIVERNEDARC